MERPEFLVISADIAAYKTVSGAIRRAGSGVNYTSTAATAKGYIARRKIDGIFLDMSLEGAYGLIQTIRQGNSNRYAVIFACISPAEEPAQLLQAGVNFLLYKPLMSDAVLQALNTATRMIQSERKRYMRHQVTLPVKIKARETEQKAITANISRGGMAIRCNSTYEPGSAIQFALNLPEGEVNGQGEVAWSNTEGFMGIKFFLLGDKPKKSLMTWLDRHEGNALAMSV